MESLTMPISLIILVIILCLPTFIRSTLSQPEQDTPHPIDKRIALTVIHILRQFFSRNENAMIMVCDNLDGKEQKREMLFARWFMQYNDGSIRKYDASSATDDYVLYVSLFMHRDNPNARQLVNAFYDLVKNNLYPLE